MRIGFRFEKYAKINLIIKEHLYYTRCFFIEKHNAIKYVKQCVIIIL